jgi:hypothetical protein
MLRVVLRVVADAVVVAIALFTAAGTVAWQRAWILLTVLPVIRLLSAIAVFRVNPALLRERATALMHHDQPWTDRILLLVFMVTAFIGDVAGQPTPLTRAPAADAGGSRSVAGSARAAATSAIGALLIGGSSHHRESSCKEECSFLGWAIPRANAPNRPKRYT